MRHWQLRSPATEQEWQSYYHLRWQILRAPWQQPVGSEQDQLELEAYHLMLVSDAGIIAGVGRLHKIGNETAQVRYMAVADEYQGKGVGSRILAGLETQAALWQCQRVQLNARETAVPFYKNYGYKVVAPAPEQFGIAHWVMHKVICLINSAQHQLWCEQLNATWQSTIPLSQYMQLTIASFNGNELRCNAPLAPNINLHHTMFAGSIYALATLTGWGMLYLQLQALGLQGDQVLAEGTIKYFKPVAELPQARCVLQNCIGDLSPLSEGQKVVQKIKVGIYSADTLAAEFTGRYAVLPVKGAEK